MMFTPATISAITGAATALGGFVSYLVRTNSSQNTRLFVLEGTVKALNDANLASRVSVVEQGLQDIKGKVAKLDLLEGMKATMEFLSGQMRDIQTITVPRGEHQAYWKSINDKVDQLPCRNRSSCDLQETP